MVGSANEVASPKSATPAYKYSCLKCKVLFSDRDALSAHYKSNWHKHNMVEISRGCKTIDEAQYNEVLSKYLALEKAKSDLASLHFECTVCSKVFHSEGTFKSHLLSNKHKERVLELKDTDAEAQTTKVIQYVDSDNFSQLSDDGDSQVDDWEDMSDEETDNEQVRQEMLLKCFMCCYRSSTPEENIQHLDLQHGFRIQYREYLLDEEEVIAYIGSKVLGQNTCLWCGRRFKSLPSCQRHMGSQGHAKLTPSKHLSFYQPELAEIYEKLSDDQFSGNLSVTVGEGKTMWHRDLKTYFRQGLQTAVVPRTKRTVRQLAITDAESSERCVRNTKHDRRRADSRVKLAGKANKFQTHFRAQVSNA